MNATAELVLMIASIVMMCVIFYFVYSFRDVRGVRYLLGVIVCRILYSSGVILEKNSELLADKLVFRHIESTALNFMVPLFLFFVYRLIGRGRWAKPPWQFGLLAGVALWSLMSWLDSKFHLVYRMIELDHNGHLATERTVYSMAFSVVLFGLLAVCLYDLFQYIRSIRSDFRKPGMWVLFLSTFPVIFEMARLIRPEWSSWMQPLSVYCGFTGALMLAIMLRIKFFSTVPFARNLVLDTIQESIVIVNASGKIIDSNKRAVEWFSDIGHGTVDGRNIAKVLQAWPEWQALCKTMQQGRTEIDALVNGERRIYSVTVSPVHMLRKQGQGSISLIVDMTEKQRHLEQIAQLNRMKDQLITIVSHDIRSPLAVQYQLIELLEADKERFEPEHREIVETLGGHIRQTLGMTHNVLEWFRTQRENMTLRPRLLMLAELAEDCRHMLLIQSEAKHIRVDNRINPGIRVFADREALGLIVRNLLTNAIKYTEQGGLVELDAHTDGDEVTVCVRDNGVGMDEEQLRQLFDESQLMSMAGTSGEKGAGLGLLVSRQFVERSGGRIWVESQAGTGSVFHFTMKGGSEDEGSLGGR